MLNEMHRFETQMLVKNWLGRLITCLLNLVANQAFDKARIFREY